MERIEHLSETDVNNFSTQHSKKDVSSCQAFSLNETGVTNETKVAEDSQGKLDQRVDNVFLDKEREVSSISLTSGESKNCLSVIAEMYSSSDEETCPGNLTEPPSNESKIAEDVGSKGMVVNNFQSVGVNPIFAQEKGASLEEKNSHLNSNNPTDTAPQVTMMVEPELLKKPESGRGTLVESDSDRQILMTTENDRHTLKESKSEGHPVIEPINDGNKQMEPESEEKVLLEPNIDGEIFMESKSDRETVVETESVGRIPTESTIDFCMPIKPESSECTLFGSRNDGHILAQLESNRQVLIEQGRDRHTLKEQENDGCILEKSKNNEYLEGGCAEHIVKIENGAHAPVEPPNDGNDNTLRKLKSDGHTLSETDNEGNFFMTSESDELTLKEPSNDGDGNTLRKLSDGHTPLETDNEGNILIKSESDEHTLVEPLNDGNGNTRRNLKRDGHTPMETDNEGNFLLKSESDGHSFIEPSNDGNGNTLRKLKSEGHTPLETDNEGNFLIKNEGGRYTNIEPSNDENGNTRSKLKSDGHSPMETDNEGNILIKSEICGHTCTLNTECSTLPQAGNNGHTLAEPDGKTCTFIEPKTEEGSLVGSERHRDISTCSETTHQVYAMSSIDKELEIISESEEPSRTVCRTEDSSSSSDSSSDDESSSSESESSESSSDDDLEDIRKEIEKDEEHFHTGPLKTKSELSVKDLPEVPDLDVTIDENVQLVELGIVFSIVESLVVVKALPQTPALDSDSVLFLENRSCLGLVFETFGPVQTPFYSVRFNRDRDITDKNVSVGDKLFYAPDMMEFSNFVFVTQLKKLKGSDASWEHDEEPPQEVVEYSDDEEESKAKANKKKERMARKGPCAVNIKKESGNSDHRGPVRGGRKRTWQSRGRGQQSNQNQKQAVPITSPPPFQHPAYRFPVPQPGDLLPSQGTAHAVQRPAFPPQSPFMSHPTQDSPPFGMRHVVPPRGLPPRGPLNMMPPQAMGPIPGPHPGPIGNVPIPSSSASRPLNGAQHMPGHWPMGPPPGFVPRYPMPGPRGTNFGFAIPPPSPVSYPPPPPPPPPDL